MAQAISDQFAAKLAENSTLQARGTLTTKSGEKVDVGGTNLTAMSYEQATSSDQSFDVGGAVVGKLSTTIENSDHRYDRLDFTDATIDMSVGATFGSDEDVGAEGESGLHVEIVEGYGSALTARVFRGDSELVGDQITMFGTLRWYSGGKQVATGTTCKGTPGVTYECRLEG